MHLDVNIICGAVSSGEVGSTQHQVDRNKDHHLSRSPNPTQRLSPEIGLGFADVLRQFLAHSFGQEQAPEDLVIDHVEWLVCSAGSDLALEAELAAAQALELGFWVPWLAPRRWVSVSLQKDIVEVSTLQEELWDVMEPSSPL